MGGDNEPYESVLVMEEDNETFTVERDNERLIIQWYNGPYKPLTTEDNNETYNGIINTWEKPPTEFSILQEHIAALPGEIRLLIITALIDQYIASIHHVANNIRSSRAQNRAPFLQLYSLALKSSVFARVIHPVLPLISQRHIDAHPSHSGRTPTERLFLAGKDCECCMYGPCACSLELDQFLIKHIFAVQRHDRATVRLDKFVQSLRLLELARIWKARIWGSGPVDWRVLKLCSPSWNADWVEEWMRDEIEERLRVGIVDIGRVWGKLRALRPKAERVKLGL